MNFCNVTLCVSLAALVSSCGQGSDPVKDKGHNPTKIVDQKIDEAQAIDQQLPQMAILRVKLVDGMEQPGTETFKTSNHFAETEEATARAFVSANSPEADELDQDSSSQQYQQGSRFPEHQSNNSQQWSMYQYEGQGQEARNCQGINCGTTVRHQQGQRTAIYPVKHTKIYRHDTVDVYPQHKVDIYPIKTVRYHPTRTTVQVHPVQVRHQFVSDCRTTSPGICGNAFGTSSYSYGNTYPAVSYRGYQQFYYPLRSYDRGGYRYYRYCRPSIFFNRYYY